MSSGGRHPGAVYVQGGAVCVGGPGQVLPGLPLSSAVREDPLLPPAAQEHTVASPSDGFQKDSDIQRPYSNGCQ